MTVSAIATLIGVLLVIVAIPFGLKLAPLALGVIVAFLGWRHVSAGWSDDPRGVAA